MKEMLERAMWRTISIVTLAMAISACADMTPSVQHEIYPPGFDIDSGQPLNSRMQQLGLALQQLDLSLASLEDQPANLQQQVISSLQEIERIAGFLQAGDISTDHPFLRDDMNEFLGDVRQARQAVSMNPPRYYVAGRITGKCINCHRANRQ
jgi:hypothetical protein